MVFIGEDGYEYFENEEEKNNDEAKYTAEENRLWYSQFSRADKRTKDKFEAGLTQVGIHSYCISWNSLLF